MQNSTSITVGTPFVLRVVNNDAVKKGLAGAAAGILVAVVQEALWPSS